VYIVGSFPGGKAAGGLKLTTNLHLMLMVKDVLNYNSTPPYVFMVWYSVKRRDNFTFYSAAYPVQRGELAA